MSTAVNTLKFVWTCWKLNLAGAMEFRVSFLLTAGMMFLNDMVWLLFWGLFFSEIQQRRRLGNARNADAVGYRFSRLRPRGVLLRQYYAAGQYCVYGNSGRIFSPTEACSAQCAYQRMAVANLGDILFGLAVYAVFGEPTLAGWGKYILSLILIMLLFLTTILIVQSLAFFYIAMPRGSASSSLARWLRSACIPHLFSRLGQAHPLHSRPRRYNLVRACWFARAAGYRISSPCGGNALLFFAYFQCGSFTEG